MTQILIDMNHKLIDVIKRGQTTSIKAFTFCTNLVDVVGVLRGNCFDCSREFVQRLHMRIPRSVSIPAVAPTYNGASASDRLRRSTWAPEPRELMDCNSQASRDAVLRLTDNSGETYAIPRSKLFEENAPAQPDFYAPRIELTRIESTSRPVSSLESSLFSSSQEHIRMAFWNGSSVESDSDAVLARNLASLGL